jgi:hypothetical protein
MEEHLSLLKSTFCQIVDMKEGNLEILHNLESRIKKIKEMYSEFISTNKDNLFVFTLDSFHFQSKLIDIEYEDMKRMFLSITNRMYCDYYKLFKIIIVYVNENVPDKKLTELIKVHDNFPIYKDLEPFKQYDFQYIQGLHEIILVILTYMHTFIANKDHDLKVYQNKNQIGLNIDSFVSTFSFNNVVMNQQGMLFINYMEFFHKLHTKYLKRFTTKLNLMLSQINNDIKLDTPQDSKNSKKETINDLKEHNLDKKLLKELKVSISDESSTISSDQTKTPDSRSQSSSDPEKMESENKSDTDSADFVLFDTNGNEQVSDITDEHEIEQAPIYKLPKGARTIVIPNTITEESSIISTEEQNVLIKDFYNTVENHYIEPDSDIFEETKIEYCVEPILGPFIDYKKSTWLWTFRDKKTVRLFF